MEAGLDRRIALRQRGQGVGIDDHARSSCSIFSNSSSIMLRTRLCSSPRSDRAPNPAIQGGRPFPECFTLTRRRSCSSSASMKNCLKVTPRATASVLACRHNSSGRSIVVFIGPCLHAFSLASNQWSEQCCGLSEGYEAMSNCQSALSVRSLMMVGQVIRSGARKTFMAIAENKLARIEVRTTPSTKALPEQAAVSSGKTVTEFLLDAGIDAAENALADRRVFRLDEQR